MARPRSFDPAVVVRQARDAFVAGGYRGTSVDDLLTATGLSRASLYQAFGSKRGLFLAALSESTDHAVDLDLLIVALMDLAADDPEIRIGTGRLVAALGPNAADRLGTRLLRRGLGAATVSSATPREEPR